MQFDFHGRVALVTGAGSGIGRECALAFARSGASVVVSDINEAGGCETVAAIERDGGTALFLRCDVSRSSEVRSLVEGTIARFGRLDYACNNAGIAGTPAATAEYPEDVWESVIATNLTGAWLCMKYELPEMLKVGGGAIVNVSSILGTVGFATASAYTAAKHGLIGLTRTAAMEYATQGVRINAVCPAFIATPMLENAGIIEGTDLYGAIAARHPMNRLGTVQEVADAVLWLCSDASTFVTGHPLLVDGGYVAQ